MAEYKGLGITKGLSNWKTQSQSVERHTDNVSYTAAHPDDTLVLAGPPRLSSVNQADGDGHNTLLAIGMIQGFQFNSQKPTQPLQSIGSGRTFFVSGKSQTTWRIGRLFANGRNLLRVLSHNAVAGGIKVENFDDPPATSSKDMYFMNLDSELFYIPFGIGAIFRDKMKDLIGSVYLELAMIQSYGVGFNAGQAMIMEDVNGMCDRVLPFRPSVAIGGPSVPRATIDEVIGFTNTSTMLGSKGTDVTDEGLGDTYNEVVP